MNNSIDQQFVEYVVKSLVGNPDAVVVERRIDEKGVLLELTVDPEDLGRVIGKRGATAQSLRTLLRALGTKNEARYNLKIVDNGVGGHDSMASSDETSPASDLTQPAAAPVAQDAQEEPVAKRDDDLSDLTDDDDVIKSDSSSPDSNDRLSNTRRELAELDDLDV